MVFSLNDSWVNNIIWISVQKLNYQHLYYFWQVAREGSITKASEKLGLAQPTISGQIAVFENSIGVQLFKKSGRNIILTEKGKLAFNYAENIFSLGQQLGRVLTGQKAEPSRRITIGTLKSIDEIIVSKFITPLCDETTIIALTKIDEKKDLISSSMFINGYDFILSDIKPHISDKIKVFSSDLGTSTLSLYATEDLANKYRDDAPWSMKFAPFILPASDSPSRRIINSWLEEKSISPKIVAEIDDSNLIKRLASSGLGIIFAPTLVKNEIFKQHKLISVYDSKKLSNSYYLLHPQKRIEFSAIQEMINQSKTYFDI